MVTFTEEIVNRKLHFLCSGSYKQDVFCFENEFSVPSKLILKGCGLNIFFTKHRLTWFKAAITTEKIAGEIYSNLTAEVPEHC